MLTKEIKPKNRFFSYLKSNKLKILIFILAIAMIGAGIISNLQNIRTQIARAAGDITYLDVSNISCSASSINFGDSFGCVLTTYDDLSTYTGSMELQTINGYTISCDSLPSSGNQLNCFTSSYDGPEGYTSVVEFGNSYGSFDAIMGPSLDVYRTLDFNNAYAYSNCNGGSVYSNQTCNISIYSNGVSFNDASHIYGGVYMKTSDGSSNYCGDISSVSFNFDCSLDNGSSPGTFDLYFSTDDFSNSNYGFGYYATVDGIQISNSYITSVNCIQNAEVNSFTNCNITTNQYTMKQYSGSLEIRATPSSAPKTCALPATTEILYCTGISVGASTGSFQPQYNAGNNGYINTSNGLINISGINVVGISPSNITPASGQTLTLTGTNFVSGMYTNLQSFGNTGNDTLRSLVIDSSGNKYIAGEFDSNITLGTTTLTSGNGYSDIFIAKTNSNGDFLWAVKAGGNSNDGLSRKNGITIDKNDGNIILTGYFSQTASFGSTNLVSNGGGDTAFFTKINSANGNFIWANKVGNLSYQYIGADGWPKQAGMGVETDSSGNVCGTGYVVTDINLNKSSSFVVKYNTSGNQTWIKYFVSNEFTNASNFTFWNQGKGTHLVVSGNDLYVTGNFSNTADFGNGVSLTIFDQQRGQANIYLAKLNATTGDTAWAKRMGSGSFLELSEIPYGVALDSSGNIYVTGYVIPASSTATFGSFTISPTSNEKYEYVIFLAKLDSSGIFQWAKPLRGDPSGSSTSRNIFIDSTDKIYIAGVATGTLTDGTTTILGDGSNAFYAKYNTSGTLQDLKIIAGSGGSATNPTNGTGGNQARAIVLDPSGRVVIAGDYSGTLGVGAKSITSAGGNDGFLVTFDPNNISVKIGTTEVPGTVVNSTTVTATTPTLTDGNYDIQVTKYSGSFGLLSGGLTAGNPVIQNPNISSLSCTPNSTAANTAVNCTITTTVNLNTLSGSVNVRIGGGAPTNCPITGSGTALACDNVSVGGTVGTFRSQYNASGSGSAYLDGNNINITSNSGNGGSCSGGGSSNTPGQTVVDLCVNSGTLTLYAGDSTKNNDICTAADITAGTVVDTTTSRQSATSVICSTSENSIALTGVTVSSKRQVSTANISDIIFEDLRGLASSNYTITATISNFTDPNDTSKKIDLGSNPDSVNNEIDPDKPSQTEDSNKIFGVLDPSISSITPLRSAATIAFGTDNYIKGSRTTVTDNVTQITLLSTSTPTKPGSIALDNVLFKLRIPSLVSAGNFQGVIVQTII